MNHHTTVSWKIKKKKFVLYIYLYLYFFMYRWEKGGKEGKKRIIIKIEMKHSYKRDV